MWVRGCACVRVAETTAIVGNSRVYACMGVCVDMGAGVVADVCACVCKILWGMKG